MMMKIYERGNGTARGRARAMRVARAEAASGESREIEGAHYIGFRESVKSAILSLVPAEKCYL